jgi:hypothetical protein
MTRFRIVLVLGLGFVVAALGGCAHSTDIKAQGASFVWTQGDKKILIVQPDVSLGELTAGGMVEPRADWTKAAQGFVAARLVDRMSRKNIAATMSGELTDPHEIQLAKLYDAVGSAVLVHAVAKIALPNKNDALDWTLGPGTNAFRDRFGTDYALFLHVNDTYATSGREAVQFLAFAACIGIRICVIPNGGNQVAFVSLVDLRTGNIVWFNFRTDETGDLRNDKDAGKFVDALLEDMPL